jgi:hypothetical protein
VIKAFAFTNHAFISHFVSPKISFHPLANFLNKICLVEVQYHKKEFSQFFLGWEDLGTIFWGGKILIATSLWMREAK